MGRVPTLWAEYRLYGQSTDSMGQIVDHPETSRTDSMGQIVDHPETSR